MEILKTIKNEIEWLEVVNQFTHLSEREEKILVILKNTAEELEYI